MNIFPVKIWWVLIVIETNSWSFGENLKFELIVDQEDIHLAWGADYAAIKEKLGEPFGWIRSGLGQKTYFYSKELILQVHDEVGLISISVANGGHAQSRLIFANVHDSDYPDRDVVARLSNGVELGMIRESFDQIMKGRNPLLIHDGLSPLRRNSYQKHKFQYRNLNYKILNGYVEISYVSNGEKDKVLRYITFKRDL